MQVLGYNVEQVNTEAKKVNYYIHAPRTTFRLVRRDNGTLFPMRANGTVCDIKGHANFTDEGGVLRPAVAL